MLPFDQEDDDEPKSFDEIKEMPVYKKGWEISELVRRIADTMDVEIAEGEEDMEKEAYRSTLRDMVGDSMIICAKIAGAEGGDLYDLRMENAAIIRKAARDVILGARGLEIWGDPVVEHLDILRRVVEDEFRPLFAEWVQSFDVNNYIQDTWGLFNPPWVNWDDPDPDADIPFDPQEAIDEMNRIAEELEEEKKRKEDEGESDD